MEWQPIETAPKNKEGQFHGPWVIGFCLFDFGVYQVRWQYDKDGNGFWKGVGADDFGLPGGRKQITHWMEKPENPKKDAAP